MAAGGAEEGLASSTREAYLAWSGHQMTTQLLMTYTMCTAEDAQGNYTLIQKCVPGYITKEI